jgi:3-hydroxyacyl-CoA dehydrogenase
MKIESIAVIGSGIMGHGIAQVAATSGIPVKLNDISEAVLEKARANIENSLEKGMRKGKIKHPRP